MFRLIIPSLNRPEQSKFHCLLKMGALVWSFSASATAWAQIPENPYAPIDSARTVHRFVSVHDYLLHFHWPLRPEAARQSVELHMLEERLEINRPLIPRQLTKLQAEVNFILRRSRNNRESRETIRDLVDQIEEFAEFYGLDRAEIATNLVQQLNIKYTLTHVQHPLETLHLRKGTDLDKSILLHRLLSEMDYHSSILHACSSLTKCELNTLVGIQKEGSSRDQEHFMLIETRTPNPFGVFPRDIVSSRVIKISDKRHGDWQAGAFPQVEKRLNLMNERHTKEFEYMHPEGRLGLEISFFEKHPEAAVNSGQIQVLLRVQELLHLFQNAEHDERYLYEIACSSISQELEGAIIEEAIELLAQKRSEVQNLALELDAAVHLSNAFLMQPLK